jgi:hypothetical protein
MILLANSWSLYKGLYRGERWLDGYWQPWYGTVPSYTAEGYRRLSSALEGVEEGGGL